MRVIDVVGPPSERGRQLGAELRDPIRTCIDLYRLVLQRDDDELRRAAAPFAATIGAFAPAIAEELVGIAEGADVDPVWILLLNARSELLSGTNDGCTAVFLPRLGLLGQTWDWLAALEDLVVVVRVTDPDGRRLVTLTEPGIVAKIGCNDAGLGVCLNFLHAPGPLRGVPVHVLLRALLDAPDLDAARAVLARAGTGRAGNVLVGTAAGVGVDVAYLGDETVTRDLGDSAFVHTNHVAGRPESGGELFDNSEARLGSARAAAPGIADVAGLVALLGDRSHPEHPICSPYRPWLGVELGTVATAVMDLRAGVLHAAAGPDGVLQSVAVAG